MGWANSFFSGMDSEVGRRRQTRLDALQADMRRSELALQQAAARRDEERLRMQQEQAQHAQERADYLDRSRQLERETAPFPRLLGTFPGAGASPYTGAAYDLNERIARGPSLASRPVADPASDAAREAGYTPTGPEAPTHGQARQSAIDEAYNRFGAAASERDAAMSALRTRLAGMRGAVAKPYSKDLEQEQRALDRMQSDIAKMEQGLVLGPDGQWQNINQILDPEIKARHASSLRRMKGEWAVRRQRLDRAYQDRLGAAGAVGFDPQEFYRMQVAQGVPEEQVLQDLAGMGFEIGE